MGLLVRNLSHNIWWVISSLDPLADTHLLVQISFYILMTHCIFVEIELSVKQGLLLIAFPEVKELNWE